MPKSFLYVNQFNDNSKYKGEQLLKNNIFILICFLLLMSGCGNSKQILEKTFYKANIIPTITYKEENDIGDRLFNEFIKNSKISNDRNITKMYKKVAYRLVVVANKYKKINKNQKPTVLEQLYKKASEMIEKSLKLDKLKLKINLKNSYKEIGNYDWKFVCIDNKTLPSIKVKIKLSSSIPIPTSDLSKITTPVSLPGGKIIINEKIFDDKDVTNEEELAFVIAHEMAHTFERHYNKRLIGYFLAKLGQQKLEKTIEDKFSYFNKFKNVINYPSYLAYLYFKMPFSHAEEFAADKKALFLMAIAGYNPEKSINVLKNRKYGTAKKSELFSYHPSPNKRINNLKKYMDDAKAIYEERIKNEKI